MTRTCFPHSKAKCSVVVRAIREVIICSIVGSFSCKRAHQTTQFTNAIQTLYNLTHKGTSTSKYGPYADLKLYQVQKKSHTLHRAIFLKITFENCEVSIFTPIATNTMAILSSYAYCKLIK